MEATSGDEGLGQHTWKSRARAGQRRIVTSRKTRKYDIAAPLGSFGRLFRSGRGGRFPATGPRPKPGQERFRSGGRRRISSAIRATICSRSSSAHGGKKTRHFSDEAPTDYRVGFARPIE